MKLSHFLTGGGSLNPTMLQNINNMIHAPLVQQTPPLPFQHLQQPIIPQLFQPAVAPLAGAPVILPPATPILQPAIQPGISDFPLPPFSEFSFLLCVGKPKKFQNPIISYFNAFHREVNY